MTSKTANEWGDLEAQFTTKLRDVRTEPVPEPIIKLAQKSLNGQPHPDDPERKLHAMQLEFDTPEKAAAFAKHMRNAGLHTKPPSSVTVIIDPERGTVQDKNEDGSPKVNDKGKPVMVPGDPVNPRKVAWRAGQRRGRAVA